MKQCIVYVLLIIFYSGCVNNSDEKLNQKIDSLQQSIKTLEKKLVKQEFQETLQKSETVKVDSVKANQPSAIKRLPITQKVKPQDTLKITAEKKITPKVTRQKINESNALGSVFYYYKSSPQKVSVEITPWHDGKRELIFFDPFGNKIYSISDIRRSYSQTTDLVRFHENGACSLAKTTINPGASMYWYETEIIFDENNIPKWKTEFQFPQESSAQNLNNKWWWDEKTNSWVKQEIVKEQPVPH